MSETPEISAVLRREAEQIVRETAWSAKEMADRIVAFASRQRAQALESAADALFAGTYKGELAVKVSMQLWLRARAAAEGTEP